jgi:hypothetical protein
MRSIRSNGRQRRLVPWLIVLAVAACSRRETTIGVAVPDLEGRLTPVARLPIVVLPYDRDSLLAELEARAPGPRPDTAAIDSLFALVRGPFSELLRTEARAVGLRDSLDRLRARLEHEPRNSPAYRAGYRAFSALADSLARAEQRIEKAQLVVSAAERQIGSRLGKLRQAVTRWEDSTLRSYDSLTSMRAGQLGRSPVHGETGVDGSLTVHLSQGSWWVYTRAPQVGNPYAGWYWNQKITGDSVRLTPATGRLRPCYSMRCP